MPDTTLEERLAEAMAKHDWYYIRSADRRVFDRGRSKAAVIEALYSELSREKGEPAAIEAWNKACPNAFKRTVPEKE